MSLPVSCSSEPLARTVCGGKIKDPLLSPPELTGKVYKNRHNCPYRNTTDGAVILCRWEVDS